MPYALMTSKVGLSMDQISVPRANGADGSLKIKFGLKKSDSIYMGFRFNMIRSVNNPI